ncbi:MAG: dipeptide epimerase [Alphaproteobacteria bacterium]|nr:dipeptide epimerase [Alphaproteobacteria bacterium]
MSGLRLTARLEHWPIARVFTISRGSKTEAVVVVAEVTDGLVTGRGECVPYTRYGESAEGVKATIENVAGNISTRQALLKLLPAGAARNAIDCALWDYEAKLSGKRVYELAGIDAPEPLTVTYTISLDTPEKMAEAARAQAARPILKIKLGQEGDAARIAAVRRAAPEIRLIADANEGWTANNIAENIAACVKAGVEMIEQPLPTADDAFLASFDHPIPLCADESVFDLASLPGLARKYDMINIKLDKCGGLTEGLALAREAAEWDLTYMVGCMVCTSLAIAPAFLIAKGAQFVDLDGALLLATDREHGMHYDAGRLSPPEPALWG